MTRETINRILTIEREATNTYREAQRDAATALEDAKTAAAALYDETILNLKQQADEILKAEQESADSERARIIATAESDASKMEIRAARRLAEAVEFVVGQVTGRR